MNSKANRVEYPERSMMNDLRKVNKIRREMAREQEKQEVENGLIEVIKRQRVPLERRIQKNLFMIKRRVERMRSENPDIKDIQKRIEELYNDFHMYKLSVYLSK